MPSVSGVGAQPNLALGNAGNAGNAGVAGVGYVPGAPAPAIGQNALTPPVGAVGQAPQQLGGNLVTLVMEMMSAMLQMVTSLIGGGQNQPPLPGGIAGNAGTGGIAGNAGTGGTTGIAGGAAGGVPRPVGGAGGAGNAGGAGGGGGY